MTREEGLREIKLRVPFGQTKRGFRGLGKYYQLGLRVEHPSGPTPVLKGLVFVSWTKSHIGELKLLKT